MSDRKISRRDFLRWSAVGASAAIVGACVPAAPAPVEAPADEATQAEIAPEAGEGGTLRVYWHPGHAYEAYEEVLAAFEEDYPGWSVNMELYQWPDMRTKLLANFAADDVPDLVEEANWVQEFAVNGHALSLDPYVEKDGTEIGFPDDWQPRTVERNQVDGETFGIQLHLTCALPFYNKTMFENAGIAEIPTTWEEFLEAAKATDQDNVFGFAVNQSQEYSWFWNLQNGVSLYDPEQNIVPMDNEAAYEAVQFQADLIHEHEVAPIPIASADYEGPQKLFVAERTAMIVTGPWDIKPILDGNPDLEWGIMPAFTRKEQATYQAGTGVFIPKEAQNSDMAWELLKRLVALETEITVTKESNMCMPRQSWAQHPEIQGMERVAPFATGLSYAVDWSKGLRLTGESGRVIELYTKALQDALYKDRPAGEALQEFVEAANQILAG